MCFYGGCEWCGGDRAVSTDGSPVLCQTCWYEWAAKQWPVKDKPVVPV